MADMGRIVIASVWFWGVVAGVIWMAKGLGPGDGLLFLIFLGGWVVGIAGSIISDLAGHELKDSGEDFGAGMYVLMGWLTGPAGYLYGLALYLDVVEKLRRC